MSRKPRRPKVAHSKSGATGLRRHFYESGDPGSNRMYPANRHCRRGSASPRYGASFAFSAAVGSRMVALVDLLHVGKSDMRVHLRCGQTRVTKQFLNESQVSPSLQQMRGA